MPQQLSLAEIERLKKSWDEAVASGKPIVLTGGIKYEFIHIPEETEVTINEDHV